MEEALIPVGLSSSFGLAAADKMLVRDGYVWKNTP